MKRLLTFVTAVMISFSFIIMASETPFYIVVIKSSTTATTRPNSVDFIPIQCVYESTVGSIFINFSEDIGNVSVTVCNMSTGETSYEFSDSATGSMTLATSGASGSYFIWITTESGDTYEGEFTVN